MDSACAVCSPTVKDPRVAGAGMVSVTAVEATPDLKYAKIYVSALNKDSSRIPPPLRG